VQLVTEISFLFCFQVSKVKVQECNVYKTCWDCLGAKDPYCGWCSLENKYEHISRFLSLRSVNHVVRGSVVGYYKLEGRGFVSR
jgi:hypothetical protein